MSEKLEFHEGERLVQRLAGVEDEARLVERIYRGSIPPAAAAFLAEQRLVVAASEDQRGRVWASLLAGPPGSFQATDERTVRISARPLEGDPLGEAVTRGGRVGLLALDPATRRRMRLNGVARAGSGAWFDLQAEQVYGNCTRYIQRRVAVWGDPDGPGSRERTAAGSGSPARSDRLTPAQRDRIVATDTLFIATRHPEHGADASHRGGPPGFVQVRRGRDGRDLVLLPDYPGNNMFNTLGNLVVDPAVGLLLVDFEGSLVLMLSGAGRIRWEPEMTGAFPGAERVIEVAVREVLALDRPAHERWTLAQSPSRRPAAGGGSAA
jgi:predicted pyridoxine 5'-phosphate oxidase superfamily flavin-nucleotide-binding protein